MEAKTLKMLLESVAGGATSVDEALDRLKKLPFENLGFARIDHHRSLRCGCPEVIYSPGKTPDQVAAIVERMVVNGSNVLATRADRATFDTVKAIEPAAEYNALARAITVRKREPEWSMGCVGVVCAGTSDLPVAEEARITLEMMDQRVKTFYDVGVAGLHRLLAVMDDLHDMNVLVVAAGMEGALASVVGGLVSVPVIAVPTSVGYGASFQGLSPLLTMLNSCVPSVAVVNIDNGFAAGYLSAMINRLADGGRSGSAE